MASRLQQVQRHVAPPSISRGPEHPALLRITMGEHLARNARQYADNQAIISQWQGQTLSYAQLHERSNDLARGLLTIFNVRKGDRIAICAGNCIEYMVLFYAVAKLGGILVALNPSYTKQELEIALRSVNVKVLFMSPSLSSRSFKAHIEHVRKVLPAVHYASLLDSHGHELHAHTFFEHIEALGKDSDVDLNKVLSDPFDIVNIQFTSGTTGSPKAACLTHHNILNNALFIGDRMALTCNDILCIPVPLFHCFGMVLGTLAAFSASSCALYPSETFEPRATLKAVSQYKCTALHGVPTMFLRILEVLKEIPLETSSLRTGIAAGTVVTAALMARITNELKLPQLTITYGMTETSPASTMSSVKDSLQQRIETVGSVMPFTTVKIVDENDRIVPRGTPGQVYTAGYLLQKGYWGNEEASRACLAVDEEGVAYMKTGDLGIMDNEGYLYISGRVKDLIIRGGENINPSEIENLLVTHSELSDSSVVGIQDEIYGEVVGVFVEAANGKRPPRLSSLQAHCREKGLAHYKIPVHVFCMGSEGLPASFPKTASGKIQKYLLRDLGQRLIKARLHQGK